MSEKSAPDPKVDVEMRERIARIIGSFVVVDDFGGPDTLVLQDVIASDYDEGVRRVYQLTDAVLDAARAEGLSLLGGGNRTGSSSANGAASPCGLTAGDAQRKSEGEG